MVSFPEMLIAIRLIQGFGGAMIFGTALAILSSVFSPGERGRALGIYIMAVYLGLTMGPFLGGILTGYLGWRSIFLVNVPLGILACILILWRLRGEWAECQGERFDLKGSVLYACSLVAVMLGLSTVPDLNGVLILSVGIVIGVIFVLYELRVPLPVLDLSLFTKNRVFAFSNLAALISYCATYAVTFLLSLYLQLTRGFSPEQAGGILIVLPAVQALLSPVAGRLSDRIDSQVLASIGIALTARSNVPAGLHLGSNPDLVPGRLPGRPWGRVWDLLVPEHQRDHELGREEVSGGGVRDERDGATRRADALDGDRDDALFPVHRAGHDHP